MCSDSKIRVTNRTADARDVASQIHLGNEPSPPSRQPSPEECLPAFISSKVRPNGITGCWEWIGARDSRGYGNVRVAGRVRKAHSVVYERLRGAIPLGLECDHLCRVPWCVNPAHVELVSHAENVRRGAARWVPAARQRGKRRCPQGHAYTKANTYVRPSTGGRACRTCDRERKRARGQKKVA